MVTKVVTLVEEDVLPLCVYAFRDGLLAIDDITTDTLEEVGDGVLVEWGCFIDDNEEVVGLFAAYRSGFAALFEQGERVRVFEIHTGN